MLRHNYSTNTDIEVKGMAKVSGRLLDIDLDVVADSEGHQLMREGNQTFGGVKTFNAPPHSQMSKPEADNTAVTKAMLMNATRCVNHFFEETLTVEVADIANGYLALSKEIPTGKESSLEIVNYEGAGPLVYGVDYGAETDRMVLTGYALVQDIQVDDELEVRYMVCGPEVAIISGKVIDILYAAELERFVLVYEDGAIYWSDDGRNWTEAEAEKIGLSHSRLWVPSLGKFMFYCYSEGGYILTSSDGKTWAKQEINIDLNSVCWAEELGKFVAVNIEHADGNILTSVDGVNWTAVYAFGHDTSFKGARVIWNATNRCFFMVAYQHDEGRDYSDNEFYASRDGVRWSYFSAYRDGMFNYIDKPSAKFFVANSYYIYDEEHEDYVLEKYLSVSKNGFDWLQYKIELDVGIHNMWCDGPDVTLGHSLDNLAFSKDGVSWWMLSDIQSGDVYGWAKERDMLLKGTWEDGYTVIDVIEDFTSFLRSAPATQIGAKKIGTLTFTEVPTGSGGSGNSGDIGGSGDVGIELPEPNDRGWIYVPRPFFPVGN